MVRLTSSSTRFWNSASLWVFCWLSSSIRASTTWLTLWSTRVWNSASCFLAASSRWPSSSCLCRASSFWRVMLHCSSWFWYSASNLASSSFLRSSSKTLRRLSTSSLTSDAHFLALASCASSYFFWSSARVVSNDTELLLTSFIIVSKCASCTAWSRVSCSCCIAWSRFSCSSCIAWSWLFCPSFAK
ncbi:hypothetical protein QBC39DRAFT_366329, partial [Podospora conica]